MKFKTIFISFNIILLFSFIFIFFMPFIMLGGEYSRLFWERNWYLALIFFCVLLGMNVYFSLNWKLFSVLETENWAEVQTLIEDRVFKKGKLTVQNIRLLLNTYLVLGRLDKMKELDSMLLEKKPDLEAEFGVEFGLPYLVKNDAEQLETHFSRLSSHKKAQPKDWIRWNLAFSHLMIKDFEAAKEGFLRSLETSQDPIIIVLSLFLLTSFGELDSGIKALLAEKKKKFREKHPKKAWEKILSKAQGNLELVILMKLVRDATAWVYDE